MQRENKDLKIFSVSAYRIIFTLKVKSNKHVGRVDRHSL